MRRIFDMRRIFNVLLVLCLGALLASPPAGAASLEGAWGLGLSADLNAPVLGLRNWYSQGPKLGIALHRVTGSKRSIELEYHYSKFTGGAIEKTAFTWGVDGNQYSSPKAKADMTFNGVAMNFVFHFPRSGQELSGEGSVPYFVFGAGFYDYRHKVSGLIYPGQKVKPLDKNKELNPIEDTRTAVRPVRPLSALRSVIELSQALSAVKFVRPIKGPMSVMELLYIHRVPARAEKSKSQR